MSTNAQNVRRWFDEVWNQGREATIDELLAPGVVFHGIGADGEPGVGAEAFRKFYRLFRAGLSDIRTTVEAVIEQGDQTAARVTMRGTHTGDGFGAPPTGRPIFMTGMIWATWKDGRVVETWNEFDAAGLMKQISGPTLAGGAPSVKA